MAAIEPEFKALGALLLCGAILVVVAMFVGHGAVGGALVGLAVGVVVGLIVLIGMRRDR